MTACQNNWYHNRDSNWLPPAQKPEAVPLEARFWVSQYTIAKIIRGAVK